MNRINKIILKLLKKKLNKLLGILNKLYLSSKVAVSNNNNNKYRSKVINNIFHIIL